ncbi:alpha-L-arabinofuranosidase C-terminal domain-containing protein [Homoserinibacter sp. YIM 151385]|uniref:alpha-L-arabinofuranosidase C-terminal domain-containing protein n=1 Tax=Homoserinibacter sp. YIM 151385 TaxID=2985506 RepID=UPI0022F0E179|nr:alpha-L-arabinofuranosidase C-terminal domain-containing protein [Homoserinibacter sp. YIM 151385]WBU37517.1 hypothetical protein OF852_11415 [Homoserinibacter sp. YIM 151385]
MAAHDDVTATVTVGGGTGSPISPMIYGAMIEHFGRTVAPGIWDQDRDIPRSDTKAAVTAMGVRALRYPGGCFSDTYHWRDGVGPKSERKLVEENFWTTVTQRIGGFGTSSSFASTPEGVAQLIGPPEPNLLGTDEFLQYCLDVDAEPFLVVNIGTGTPEEAADWVRYTNIDRHSPRPVTWWSIGNETWGTHEFGHSEPDVYGRRIVEFATAMRAVDPTIKLVGVGLPVHPSGGVLFDEEAGGMVRHTARAWNEAVLREAAAHIDLLSVHWYFPGMIERPLESLDDLRQLTTSPQLLDEIFTATTAMVDEVAGTEHRIDLSFDEWNRMVVFDDHLSTNHPLGNAAFFAGVYNAMLEHADRIPIAILSHLVNCLAPIQTSDDRLFVTVSYLVAQLYERHGRGTTVPTSVSGPEMAVPAFEGLQESLFLSPMVKNGRTAQVITAAAARDGDTASVFIVNAEPEAAQRVRVEGLEDGPVRLRWIDGPDVWSQNDLDHPDTLRLREATAEVEDGVVVVTVPPAGVLVVTR